VRVMSFHGSHNSELQRQISHVLKLATSFRYVDELAADFGSVRGNEARTVSEIAANDDTMIRKLMFVLLH